MKSTLNAALHGYRVIGEPIAPSPVSVADVLTHLKLDPTLVDDATISAEITVMINAAISYGEDCTKRTFLESNFKANWDGMFGGSYPYEVRKFPFGSVSALTYYYCGTLCSYTTSGITTEDRDGFSRIKPAYGEAWPTTSGASHDVNLAELSFTAGYADGELPNDLKLAVLMHVAALWANRGDCNGGNKDMNSICPWAATAVYAQKRIVSIWAGA